MDSVKNDPPKTEPKIGTVALVVQIKDDTPQLIEAISDDREIALLEAAIGSGEGDPLEIVYEMRSRQTKEEDEFGDYVEELLCQPFVRPEIADHGIQWLKSKIRIEQYRKSEQEASKVIAGYAFKLYTEDSSRVDFYLAGPSAKVRVKIFALSNSAAKKPANAA